VLIVVFIVAAILTPPDVMSQTAMAIPMYLLYEGGILFAAILQRSSRPLETSEPAPRGGN
jgi:sec-independent protein translocase protein TatC